MTKSKEIEIKEIFYEFFASRLYIFFILLLVSFSWLIYVLNHQPYYTGYLKIKGLTLQQLEPFATFQTVFDETDRDGIMEQKTIIFNDSDHLQKLIVDEMISRDGVRDILRKIHSEKKVEFEYETQFENFIRKLSYRFQIIQDISRDINKEVKNPDEGVYTIQYSSHSQSNIKEIFSEVIDLANAKTKNNLEINLEKFLNNYELLRFYQLQDIDLKINNSISDHETAVADRIEFLNEQAKIAQALEIENYFIGKYIYSDLDDVSTSDVDMTLSKFDGEKYYLNGYKAINAEINILESRDNSIPFIIGIRSLMSEKRDLEQNSFAIRVKDAYAKLPINDAEYKLVNYDLSNLKINKVSRSNKVTAAYAFILFIFISFLIVFIRLIRKFII